jgi:hypothetical protein
MKNNYLESRYNANFSHLMISNQIQNIYNILKTKADLLVLINYLQHKRHDKYIYDRWSDVAWFNHWLIRLKGMLEIERRKPAIQESSRLR